MRLHLFSRAIKHGKTGIVSIQHRILPAASLTIALLAGQTLAGPAIAPLSKRLAPEVQAAVDAAHNSEIKARAAQSSGRLAARQAEDAAKKAQTGAKGFAAWANADETYAGQVKPGTKIRQGFGVWTNKWGKRYEGAWQNDKRNGVGVFTWPTMGERYEGEFRDGAQAGYGVYADTNSIDLREEVGQFHGDADLGLPWLKGYGLVYRNNGYALAGQFRQPPWDARSGYGADFDSDWNVAAQGLYDAGKLKTRLYAPVLRSDSIDANLQMFDSSDAAQLQTIRLDVPGGSLASEPLRTQEFADCYAQAAATLWDAYLALTGKLNPDHPVSAEALALDGFNFGCPQCAAASVDVDTANAKRSAWGIVHTKKSSNEADNFTFYFEGGNTSVAFRANRMQSNAMLLCPSDAVPWLSSRESLVAFWKANASAEEQQSVLQGGGDAPPGTTPAMRLLSQKVTAACKDGGAQYAVQTTTASDRDGVTMITVPYFDDRAFGATAPVMAVSQAKGLVDYELANGMPVAVDICAADLADDSLKAVLTSLQNPPLAVAAHCGSDRTSDHVVVIAGRRISSAGGRQEYLIRNSWGTDCSQYAPSIRAECEPQKGAFWLDAYRLFAGIQSLSYLREIASDGGVRYSGPVRKAGSDELVQASLNYFDAARSGQFDDMKDVDLSGTHCSVSEGGCKDLPLAGGSFGGAVRGYRPAGLGSFTPEAPFTHFMSHDLSKLQGKNGVKGNWTITGDFSRGFGQLNYAIINVQGALAYAGEMQGFAVTGNGRMHYASGSISQGHFYKGQEDGRVSVKLPDGTMYEAMFKDGKEIPGTRKPATALLPLPPFPGEWTEAMKKYATQ